MSRHYNEPVIPFYKHAMAFVSFHRVKFAAAAVTGLIYFWDPLNLRKRHDHRLTPEQKATPEYIEQRKELRKQFEQEHTPNKFEPYTLEKDK